MLQGEGGAQTQLMAERMLRVLVIQIPLYGVAAVTAGVLQAHRRFLAPAVAPILSSVVVAGTYLVFAASFAGRIDLAAGSQGLVAVALPGGVQVALRWAVPRVDVVLDQLGAGTFIGREMLMKKYSTSYTAARAAWLDAWKHLLDMRTTIVARTFCQPVYETFMAEAVALGRIRAPGFFSDARLRWAYTRCAWHGDSQGSLNPKDEVTAYGDAVDRRLMTREQAEWQLNGTSWQDTYPTKLAEHQRMVKDQMLPVPKAGAPAPQPTGEQA
jgi:hypothetical protein